MTTISNGSFGSDGVTTTVRCSSTHLTSFAVLVDVAGGLTVTIASKFCTCVYLMLMIYME